MVIYAVFGLLVGALLNLLADIVPQKLYRLQAPRCPYCGQAYPPAAWIATFGFIIYRGKCPNCGHPIPWRRPILELATASVFAFLWLGYGLSGQLAILSLYTALLLLIFVIDLETRLVPNIIVLPAMALAGGLSLIYPGMGLTRSLLGGAIGFSFFYLVALVGRGGMGAGDVKLAGFIGLITGFPEVIFALIVATVLGGLITFLLVVSRRKGLKDFIPYGPFLVVGGLTALLYGSQVVDWYLSQYL